LHPAPRRRGRARRAPPLMVHRVDQPRSTQLRRDAKTFRRGNGLLGARDRQLTPRLDEATPRPNDPNIFPEPSPDHAARPTPGNGPLDRCLVRRHRTPNAHRRRCRAGRRSDLRKSWLPGRYRPARWAESGVIHRVRPYSTPWRADSARLAIAPRYARDHSVPRGRTRERRHGGLARSQVTFQRRLLGHHLIEIVVLIRPATPSPDRRRWRSDRTGAYQVTHRQRTEQTTRDREPKREVGEHLRRLRSDDLASREDNTGTENQYHRCQLRRGGSNAAQSAPLPKARRPRSARDRGLR